MVLDTVSDFFGYSGLASEGLPCPSQIPVCNVGNDAAIPLPPHEGIERTVTHWPLRIFGRGKSQPSAFGLIDLIRSAASNGTGIAWGMLFLVFDQSMMRSAASGLECFRADELKKFRGIILKQRFLQFSIATL